MTTFNIVIHVPVLNSHSMGHGKIIFEGKWPLNAESTYYEHEQIGSENIDILKVDGCLIEVITHTGVTV